MSWEIEVFDEFERGTMDGLVDRAVCYLPDSPTQDQVDKAVLRAIDEGVVHYSTMLAAIQHFGMTSDAFDLVYEDLFNELSERVCYEIEED